MKVKQAFPGILGRQYPIVKAGYPLLTVIYLLRMKDVDAVPIVPITRKKKGRAVFGFSSLFRFMNLEPEEFADLLRRPCEAVSDELALVSVDDELESLLRAFESRRLGVACVHEDTDEAVMKTGLVGLVDVLALYATGTIRSELSVADVSTPIFSMPDTTTIREALHAMFRRRYRRVFLSGKGTFISDRSMMSYLFSPMVLEELGRDSGKRDVLSTPLAKVEQASPLVVSPRTSLKMAALELGRNVGGCLVTRDNRVITPWDTAMKPWQSGDLIVS